MNTKNKHAVGPVGISYAAYVSEKGEGFLGQAVYHSPACGCRIIGNGTLPYPLTIAYCPIHKAVPDLLAACEAVERAQLGRDYEHAFNLIHAALSKARGES